MRKPDGGPAFPVVDGSNFNGAYGMTLRDWFAGKCMIHPDVLFASLFSGRWAARLAYRRADAMIAELEKES